MDVSARVDEISRLDGDAPAIQYAGQWLSWEQIRARIDTFEALLDAAGVGEGARIGVVVRNRPALVAAILSVVVSRRCLVPISSIQPDELVVRDAHALPIGALIADGQDWNRAGLAAACAELGIAAIDAGDGTELPASIGGSSTRSAEPDPEVAILMPTSGTTGPPKRIRITYRQLNGGLERIAGYSDATSRALLGPPKLRAGVTLAALPMAHIAGLWAAIQAIAEGRRLSLLERFDAHQWADLVEEHRAKFGSIPPTAVRMVLEADIDPERLRSLTAIACGTAPLDPALADAFTSRFGVPVLSTYGATEFPGGLVGWTLGDHQRFWATKKGSAGRCRPGISLRIVDAESGVELPAESDGIISVLSPQATSATDADGWVRTNDIGRLDEDGFLWVVGRADDAIIRGGFKVLPQAIEKVLAEHPAVVDVSVVGLPDERLGHVPVAAVVVTGELTGDELIAWSRSRLANYQVPVAIDVLGELPRTPSMKVNKSALRELLTAHRAHQQA